MIGLITARAEVEIFGSIKEKEDIASAEFERRNSNILIKIKNDFTLKLIKESGVFAVNIPRLNFEREKEICDMHGEFEDKFKLTGFERKECSSIDCPAIGKSDVIECSAVNVENSSVYGKILKETRL